MWILTISAFSQNRIIVRGVVTDSQKEEVIGATIIVKGNASQGTVTDFNGKYELRDVPTNAVLVFSYVGYKTQEISVDGRSSINVTLGEDTELLDEVVIVGYGSMRKGDITGAIVSIKPTQDDAAIATSLDDLLQGKAAGVSISTGGSTPGSAGSVIIRGANSLQGDSQPLYIIDNVPQSSTGQTMGNSSGDYLSSLDPLAGINPNDIEDIQILKDASATAIYGSRGANGVILITTKRGKAGKTNIRVSANFSFADPVDFIDVMNLGEYAAFWNKKYPNDQRFVIDGNTYKYIYSSKDENGQSIQTESVITNRDWQKEATRSAFSQEYNLNINGGSANARYNFSSSFKNIEGIAKTTGIKHGDFRLNLDTNISDKVTFGAQISGFLRKGSQMSGGNTVGRISGGLIPTALNSAPFVRPTDDVTFDDSPESRATVLSWITDYDDISNEFRFSASTNVDYKITDHFKYTFRAGGNLNNVDRENWYGLELYRGDLNNGYLSQNSLKRNNYNVENLLFYNNSFGIVNIDATVGVTYDAYQLLNTGAVGLDFDYHNLRTDGLHTANNITLLSPGQNDYQLLSYLGRLNASFFKGKYVFTGTMRSDGSSKFSDGNRWGYFPSFALAWNVAQEDFLSNSEWLSQFKLRTGYGETGSQNISPYSTIFGYGSVGQGYATPSGGLVQGLGVKGINNSELKWEKTESINVGVDFGLFNSRISGSVDVYSKTTKDLLVDIALPGSTATSFLTVNRGEIGNKGVEATLSLDVIRKKDFKWNIGGNIAFNKSIINKIGSQVGDYGSLGAIVAFQGNSAGDHFGSPNIFIEGEAPGLFYGFKTDGIVQEGDDYVVGNPFGNANAPGNFKVVDVNNDGVVDLADKTIIGDPNPDYTYGFQTSLNYKQLRLKASFSGVQGGDVFNANNRYNNLANFQSGDRNYNPAAIANAWTPENPSNVYPSIFSNVVNGHINDRYIEDGSYLRLTDVTLGYTFNKDISNKLGISNLDVFASVKNAFTISNYSGYDPTSRSFNFDPLRRGLDLYSFPAQRQVILGINLTF